MSMILISVFVTLTLVAEGIYDVPPEWHWIATLAVPVMTIGYARLTKRLRHQAFVQMLAAYASRNSSEL